MISCNDGLGPVSFLLETLEQLKRDFGDLDDEFDSDYADDETMDLHHIHLVNLAQICYRKKL